MSANHLYECPQCEARRKESLRKLEAENQSHLHHNRTIQFGETLLKIKAIKEQTDTYTIGWYEDNYFQNGHFHINMGGTCSDCGFEFNINQKLPYTVTL